MAFSRNLPRLAPLIGVATWLATIGDGSSATALASQDLEFGARMRRLRRMLEVK